MKKLTFLILILTLSSFAVAQTQVVEDFEEPTDSTFWEQFSGDNADSAYTRADPTFQTSNAISGSAMTIDWAVHNSESWGGFTKIEHVAPDSQVYDWSAYDSISFYIYVENPQTLVGRTHLRFNVYEVSDVPDTTRDANQTEFYYSFLYDILDDSSAQWQKITLPLEADPNYWDGEGFNRTGWSGVRRA